MTAIQNESRENNAARSLLLRVFTQARPKADIRVGARQSLALQSPIGWALDIHWRAAIQNAYRCRTMRAIEAGLLSVEPEAY